jgi:hypothetical protein
MLQSGNQSLLRRAAVIIVAALLTAGSAAYGNESRLQDNRARWEAANIEDYSYGYNKYCECHRETPPETVVTILAGQIVRVHHLHPDSDREVPADPEDYQYYWTIEGLFELIGAALNREVDVRADYDEALGFPTRIFIDYDADQIGEELDLRITRLIAR